MPRFLKPHFLAPLILQKIIWVPTRLVLIIFGRHKVYGLENLKSIKGPVLFACNHSSEIDPFMTPASLPFFSRFSPLFYIVREKSFYTTNGWRKHLFASWFIMLWGGHGAQVGLKDYDKALARQVGILKEGGSFCIFPEGGITRDGRIQPAKGGIAYMTHTTSCTVVPVAISNVYNMSASDFFKRKRSTSISFGKPITPDELTNNAIPTDPAKSKWKEEGDYIMKKVEEMVTK